MARGQVDETRGLLRGRCAVTLADGLVTSPSVGTAD